MLLIAKGAAASLVHTLNPVGLLECFAMRTSKELLYGEFRSRRSRYCGGEGARGPLQLEGRSCFCDGVDGA